MTILRTLIAICITLVLPLAAQAQSAIDMVERFVPHVSTAPVNEGERVGIYLREKWSRAAADRWAAGESRQGSAAV